MLRIAHCHIYSAGPYSQSAPFLSKKKDKEKDDAFEERVWRERMTVNKDGIVCIPSMGFKMAMADAAAFNSKKIPGKKNATYTKHFRSGLVVLENIPLGIHRDDVKGEPVYVNADGKRGSGTRVWRIFPVIPHWEASVPVHILDDTITEEVFAEYLAEAGSFIGLGRFRPQNGGIYGRFKVRKIDWQVE